MGVKKAILTTAVGVATKPETTPFWLPHIQVPGLTCRAAPAPVITTTKKVCVLVHACACTRMLKGHSCLEPTMVSQDPNSLPPTSGSPSRGQNWGAGD